MKERRVYTTEFKREAVRLSEQADVSVVQVAQELGVSDYSLYKWRKQAREGGELAFPGNGKVALSAEQQENQRLRQELGRVKQERDILKKATVGSSGQWSVSLMARTLAVSISGFYGWLKRGKSKRAADDEKLTEKIVMFHCGSRCTYGSPRIHKDLKAAGHEVGRKRVARLMRSAGIRGKAKRKHKTTTNAKHSRPKAENLVKQNFDVATSDTLWASDITYVLTAEGWLYLAVTLDLFSRKVIGWAFSDRLTDDLTLSALKMATQQRPALSTLTHHSVQGVQYASTGFRAALKAHGIRQSMSGKGNCYDNAVVESFFATLKTEEVGDADYQTRQQAKTSIFSYLEGFYNAKRRHSSLGYLSPNDFERIHFAKAA